MQAIRPGKPSRRLSLYDQRMEDAAQAVRDAISAIVAMTNPQARAAAATEVLKVLTDANGVLSKLRQEDIKGMRSAGLSYRQIGAALGIHFTRVKQIESGAPTGNSARSRAAKERPDA
jgi:hypothetical protein